MSKPDLVVYGFETSNNMKVRIALGYKGIPYEFRAIDPAERAAVIELSGQHLTPVMQHGDRVLFDSAAILRYLDANFKGAAKLFGASRDEQWAIEDWEMFARAELAGPMMNLIHKRVAGTVVSPAEIARCQADFTVAVEKLAAGLRDRAWLVGSSMSAADITAASVLRRVQLTSLFELTPSPVVAGWIGRVMEFDAVAKSQS